MIIGYARVSTTVQDLGLRHDELKPARNASVDQTEARSKRTKNNAKPGGGFNDRSR
jgi:DNA invertase Pin-like site-specific DNA recombinase